MTKIEKKILLDAYKQYFDSYERSFVITPTNGTEFVSYLNTLSALVDEGYLICNSDNLDQDTYQISPRYELVFDMELTDSGIAYVRREINP